MVKRMNSGGSGFLQASNTTFINFQAYFYTRQMINDIQFFKLLLWLTDVPFCEK